MSLSGAHRCNHIVDGDQFSSTIGEILQNFFRFRGLECGSCLLDQIDAMATVQQRICRTCDTDIGGHAIEHDSQAITECLQNRVGIRVCKYIEGLFLDDNLLK